MTTHITIRGAAEHNLRDIDVDMPRNRLTAVTGISGSGKSSLAHDVVYREGQRRFIESLSPYARQYLGRIDKPRVEHIEGLSPTISIDQKTISRNPRSTVGTITEILDHLRLLYARLGEPHCPECGEAIQSRSVDQIVDAAFLEWPGEEVLIAAPIVLDRKGEYRKELDELRAQGFVRARIDGELRRLDEEIELARYERHTVEVVYDRVRLSLEKRSRFSEAVEKALALGDGLVNLVVGGDDHLSSCRFACPRCDVSLPELEPRLFSFNSPHGACLRCEGLGQGRTVDLALLVPDPGLSLREGALAITGQRGDLLFCDVDLTQLEGFAAGLDFDLDTPWRRIPRGFRDWLILGAGRDGKRAPALRKPQRRGAPRARRGGRPRKRSRKTPTDFPGVIPILEAVYRETRNPWLEQNLIRGDCPECGGSRLRPEARAVLFRERSIAELCRFTVEEGRAFFDALAPRPREQQIGAPIFREIGA
ncbi:MAG: excinuclease ABC subunit UvrA, partial [Planctomycetota bacterium]